MTGFTNASWLGGQSLFAIPYVPVAGSQTIAVAGATNLTPPVGAIFALISVEVSNVRYWDDGTVPTSTTGQLMSPNAAPLLYAGNLSAIKFIAVSGSPVLQVSYYK